MCRKHVPGNMVLAQVQENFLQRHFCRTFFCESVGSMFQAHVLCWKFSCTLVGSMFPAGIVLSRKFSCTLVGSMFQECVGQLSVLVTSLQLSESALKSCTF